MALKSHTVDDAAKLLVTLLQVGRKKGTITPDAPIKGKEIAARWNKKYPADDVDDVDVREWVNHARAVLGMPIYSCRGQGKKSGYAWCINEAEWKRTRAHILSAIKLQLAAAEKPNAYFTHRNQEEAFNDADHAGNNNTGGSSDEREPEPTVTAAVAAFLEEGGATLVGGTEAV